MAKKNQGMKDVNEILDNAVVTTEESLLDETLAIDMEKLSKDLEEMKQEIFDEKMNVQTEEKTESVEDKEKEETETVENNEKEETNSVEEVVEKPKSVKKINFRSFGAYWNGQDFGY